MTIKAVKFRTDGFYGATPSPSEAKTEGASYKTLAKRPIKARCAG